MTQLEGRLIDLDGVVEQQANYAKSGFILAYRNVHYEGVAGGSGSVQGADAVIDLSAMSFTGRGNAFDRRFSRLTGRHFSSPG